MKTVILLMAFQFLAVLSVVAQDMQEKTALKQERFRKVDYYHVGIGMESGVNENWHVGPIAYMGIGSYRNLLNVDIGIGYQLYNPLGSMGKERIMLHQLPFFASVHFNMARWSSGCVYVGGEAMYSLAVKGQHVVPHADVAETENTLGCSHTTISGMLGVRLNHWDLSFRFAYDLSPSMNQKYVFESPNYDYDCLYTSLFERNRFVLNISYLIPF